MTLNDFTEKLKFKALSEYQGDKEVNDGYTSDLLSDVMGNAPDESVLITIQAHKNTVAVAILAGIEAIILCNGRTADEEMIKAAEDEDIAIFGSDKNQFQVSAMVNNLLNS